MRAAAALLLVALAACSSSSSGSPEPAVEHGPPGTPVGDAFVVPDGARLVGTRFPGPVDGAWEALLLVDDDPAAVLRDLVAQAEGDGLTVGARDFRGVACPDLGPSSVVECSLSAARPGEERTYDVRVWWGATARHVRVAAYPLGGDVGPPLISSDLGPLDEPEAWSPPSAGDPVARELTPATDEPIVVERGSSVVAPPAPATCVTGGYQAVLAVSGDPDDVVAAYAEQFVADGFDGPTTRSTFDGREVVAARHTAAGGGNLDAVAVVGSGGEPTWLLLSRCND